MSNDKYDRHITQTDVEHVISRTDQYAGSKSLIATELYIKINNNILKSNVKIVPPYFNAIEEIITNAFDQALKTRITCDKKITSTISIGINDEFIVYIKNDGRGINFNVMNDGLTLVESIYTRFRSGTNLNDNENRYVGGRNGMGASITTALSTFLKVTTVFNHNMYIQKFVSNGKKIIYKKATISKCQKKDYTHLIFNIRSDFRKGMNVKLIRSILDRRCCELSMILNLKVKFMQNKYMPITIPTFVKKYIDPLSNGKFIISDAGILNKNGTKVISNWNVYLWVHLNKRFELSYVNGKPTPRRGIHIDYIRNKLLPHIRKVVANKYHNHTKKDSNQPIKSKMLWEMISYVIVVYVDGPKFDDQAKTRLTDGKLAKLLTINETVARHLKNNGIKQRLKGINISVSNRKKPKSRRRMIINKYLAARYSKTKNKNNKNCILFIAEGDSAAGQIQRGLKVLGRQGSDFYGIYTGKGKFKNVQRGGMKNVKIDELMDIIGLVKDADYTGNKINKLYYQHIIIFTDADVDGFHICGLLMNIFYTSWPSLITHPKFLSYMQTPYVRIYNNINKNKLLYEFQSNDEFIKWKQNNKILSKQYVKFYKGIAANSPDEIRSTIQNRKKNQIYITYDDNYQAELSKAFDPNLTDQRKKWISQPPMQTDEILASINNNKYITCSNYINTLVYEYSIAACDRSIPRIDGLKVSQRKILWAMMMMNNKREKRVSILAAEISSLSHYEHGEKSLSDALSGMARCWCGTNNINYFQSDAGFGTRDNHIDGEPRYCNTRLMSWVRLCFMKQDDNILDYTYDENGKKLEPVCYAPIIPIILVNGCRGIATGFSTSIPTFNPIKLIDRLLDRLDGCSSYQDVEFMPWYIGYKNHSKIELFQKNGYKNYFVYGIYKIIDNMLYIYELPPLIKELSYQEHLNVLKFKKKVYDWHRVCHESSDKYKFCYEIELGSYFTNTTPIDNKKIIKEFRLKQKIHTNNMYIKTHKLIAKNNIVKKYDMIEKCNNISDIFNMYYKYRYLMYEKRIKYIINHLKYELQILKYKMLYIQKCRQNIIQMKQPLDDIKKSIENNIDTISKFQFKQTTDHKYAFLYKMPMISQSVESFNRIKKQHNDKLREYNIYLKVAVVDLWKSELLKLKAHISKK